MTLEQLLEQINLFVDEVKTLKEEKETIEISLESYKAQISELETENSILNEQVLSLNAENSSLKEQANLNLIKVQEIVNELKEILSKE
jgi:predicted nuclease with TOPRIM domain